MNISNNNDVVKNFFTNKKITSKKRTKKMNQIFQTKNKDKIVLEDDINTIMMNTNDKTKWNKFLKKYNNQKNKL
jgi:hypothetical protein